MTIQMQETEGGKLLEVRVSGTLTHSDYRSFVPRIESLQRAHGKLSILFEMEDLHGWECAAAWDDLSFGMKHHANIARLAMVGDKPWERGMSWFCRPFTSAKVRYFDRSAREEARAWVVRSGLESTTLQPLDQPACQKRI